MENTNANSISEILEPSRESTPGNSDLDNSGGAISAPLSSDGGNIADAPVQADNINTPVNSTAIPIRAEELLEKRGRGRPKGTGKKKSENGATNAPDPEMDKPSQIGVSTEPIAGSEPAPGTDPFAAPGAPQPPATDYKALSELTVAMGTNTLAMVFGPEWQPDSDNERIQLASAIEVYMRHKGVEDIPPGALLGIVLLTYSAKRFRAPSTASKIKLGWSWLKSKFSKGKKFKPQLVDATEVN